MKRIFPLLSVLPLLFLTGCAPGQLPGTASGQPTDKQVFQESQTAGPDSVWGLLGTEIDTSIPGEKDVYDQMTGETYTEYTLVNGGTVGINQHGIVALYSPREPLEARQEKDWDSVAEIIASDLELEGYTITGNGPTGTGFYDIVWQREIEGVGTNPLDSVKTSFDPETLQLRMLFRFCMEANATKPKLTPEEAVKIASERFYGTEADSIKLTYAQPNANVDTDKPPELLFEARLAYVVKGPIENGTARIKVDALTGEVIASTTAVHAAENKKQK